MNKHIRSALLVTASILSLTGTAAWSQTAPAADSKGQAAEVDDAGIGEIIVTAQKRSENVQNVPIAVSAFSADALQERGLNGGTDLQLAVPNVSFNDTGYGRFSFQIRGIGSQIQGTSADTGVGVHENNIPLTVNRLPSAEFYDIERIEVLRGPQGTLYGRNSTGGVVNTITASPKSDFGGEVSGEYASFNRVKLNGMLNVPLSDTFAVRAAGVFIDRKGDTFNSGTGEKINSRHIWSTRLSAQWEPSNSFRARAMWEHFDQNDTSGDGKQICAADPGPTSIGGVATNPFTQAMLSRGCLLTSPTDPRNTGAPGAGTTIPGLLGVLVGVLPLNAYTGSTVSTDLHTVNNQTHPTTKAKNDLFSLDLQLKLGDSLTLSSISAYSNDRFNRVTQSLNGTPSAGFFPTPLTPGGSFTDPQVGTATTVRGYALTQTTGKQFSQELRLQSSFDGIFNFNIGGIYIDYKATNDIYFFGNTNTIFSIAQNSPVAVGGSNAGIYIDPNANPDGTGHNYYLASNPYHLKAGALFGEGYFNVTSNLKATLGLRYTHDSKFQETRSIDFLAPGRGFSAITPQRASWGEVTGRFTVDWQPTKDTLVYGSYSRGYKGGGFNPGNLTGTGFNSAFDPEFINAIEFGTKNTLFDRKLMLNLTGFYYDYSGYQISQAVNLTIATQNINAKIKGLEFEAVFQPVRALRFDTQIGYLDTSISNGSSINPFDPTLGDPSVALVRSIDPGSFANLCALPVAALAGVQGAINGGFIPSPAMASLCTGPFAIPGASFGTPVQLKGHQLPYSPHWTLSFGAEYGVDLAADWRATLRADYHYQSASFATMFNTTPDEIKGYGNLNLSLKIASDSNGLEVLGFARNLLDQQAITTIQVGTAQTGYNRIVFGKERTSYGVSITKRF
jgi:outer membrane receptor protein involved in Fe transport